MIKKLFYNRYMSREESVRYSRLSKAFQEMAEGKPEATANLEKLKASLDEMSALHRKVEAYYYAYLKQQCEHLADAWTASTQRTAFLDSKAKDLVKEDLNV